MEYKVKNNVEYSCKYHVVWCPKYRRKVLIESIAVRLKELIKEQATAIEADIIQLDILPDHVHLLLEINPQYGINKAVRSIKNYSSAALRKEFPELKSKLPGLWTTSYFVTTVDGIDVSYMQKYIESQPRSQRKERRDE